jgi:hypothetical protein
MSIISESPARSEEKRLMAKRIRNWINKPDADPELMELIIKSGHLEDLKVFLKNETDSKETYSCKTSQEALT